MNDERIWLDALPKRSWLTHRTNFRHSSRSVSAQGMAFEAVRQANRLNPDIIALTGDFVTYSRANIGPAAETAGRVCGRATACMRCSAITISAWMPMPSRRRCASNASRCCATGTLPWRSAGSPLYLAGVDDYGYGADLRRAMRGVPRDAATMLLAHNPRVIHLASRHNVSLVLSGHTHGGQVNLPLLGTVYGRSPNGCGTRSAGTAWGPRKFT